ncbi:DUF4097 domain-containing protein [Deinococcus alpinitundrae]|uniref:DUF4097 domain-containing protein n=1 Tax=Deinococcus alpinitundrae TaxID=468913 RepID=UPI00137B646A|nr:DUF4097 domain-containing protein [Deinococcus alpinitundrae]
MKPLYLAALLTLSSSSALAATYTSVSIALKQELGSLVVNPNNATSPVLGVRNPPIKNGVAYVGASHSQGDWAIGLSPKLPLSLILDRTQGDAQLDLRSLKLTALSLKQTLGNLDIKLPAANLKATLDQQQGDTTLMLAPNTGIRVDVKSFKQGTLIIGGKTVADGLSFDGSYQSANYTAARYKVELTVTKELGSLTIR